MQVISLHVAISFAVAVQYERPGTSKFVPKLSLHHVIQSILLWIRELVPQFIQQNYRYKLNNLPSF